MTILVLGLLLFLGIHLLPSLPGARSALIDRLGGEMPYKGVYSLVSLAGLVLIVIGMMQRDFVSVYAPPAWGRHVAAALMLPAVILLAAANMPSSIKRVTPHPMLWGVLLWATAHLLANGDLGSLILFASFGLFAIFDIGSANRRGAQTAGPVPLKKDLITLVAGGVAYVALLFAHPWFTGMPVLVG